MDQTDGGRRDLVSIQYLRAFAALMVVCYHANRWAWRDFDIGAAGVDVFFVISGFVLWTSITERPLSPATFLRRRLVRVAPLYWLLTLLVAGAAALWPGLFWEADPEAGHLLLSLAFIQHFNPDGRPFPVISAGWSLNYEMVFYLIMAAALCLPKAWRFAVLAVGLVAVPVFGFIHRPAYFLGANPMFLQFLAGAALAGLRFADALPSRTAGWIAVGFGLAGFAVAWPFDLFEHLWRPLFWGVPALLLVFGAVTVEARGGMRDIPPLRFLGDASYSLYLTHVAVVELMAQVVETWRAAYVFAAIAASIVGGCVCYLVVERPLLRLFSARSRRAVLPKGPT